MDSRWFHHQAVGASSNDNPNLKAAGRTLDLSLKLGLTNTHEDESKHQLGLSLNSLSMSSKLQNFRFNGSLITKEANQYEMANGKGKVGAYQSGIFAGGSSSAGNYGSSNIGLGAGAAMNNRGMFAGSWNQVPRGYGFNIGGGNSGGSSFYNQQGLNANRELFGTLAHNFSGYNPGGNGMPPFAMNYSLFDHVPRNARRDAGSSSVARKRRVHRQRQTVYYDPDKRCSNPYCNTKHTPMWRKGPRGPKTLCNACGIKYSREAEKKKGLSANWAAFA